MIETVLRAAQTDRCAIAKSDHFLVPDGMDLGLRLQTLYRQILNLPAIDRIGNAGNRAIGEALAFCITARWHADPHQHGNRIIIRKVGRRWMPPTILQVTVLTGTGIEQWPQTIGALG